VVHLYAVIGEHDTDPDRLLVIGEDGQHYAWYLTTDETIPVDVDDGWRIDANLPAPHLLFQDELELKFPAPLVGRPAAVWDR
jgi:hypothetical protein